MAPSIRSTVDSILAGLRDIQLFENSLLEQVAVDLRHVDELVWTILDRLDDLDTTSAEEEV